MSTQEHVVTTERAAVADRNLELIGAFSQSVLADPTNMDVLPDGATVVLLPEDDPDFVETIIQLGLTAVRRGESVYFCHVRRTPEGMVIPTAPARASVAERD